MNNIGELFKDFIENKCVIDDVAYELLDVEKMGYEVFKTSIAQCPLKIYKYYPNTLDQNSSRNFSVRH